MKIAMMGSSYCLDTDICIIHGLQKKGFNVKYFFSMHDLANPLFRLKNYYPYGIIPAKSIKEMYIYKDYVNLDDLYMISAPRLRFRSLKLLWLYIKVMWRIIKYAPNLVHHTWPWVHTPAIAYLLPYKKSMFVHDPIPHSSDTRLVYEKYRRLGYRFANKLILLNDKTTNEFCERYNVSFNKIAFSQLCIFDYLRYIPSVKVEIKEKYLLFFGQIASYKGVDLLMMAMKRVHEKHPNWRLVVAGGGKMYFDISEYEHLDYIEIRNYFIDLPELVGLIKNCEFVVAPYRDATQSGIINNAISLYKPVIATNVGNFCDVIKDKETGIIIPPDDVNALCVGINKMIEHPELRERMAKTIETDIKNNDTNNSIINNLIDVFENMIK